MEKATSSTMEEDNKINSPHPPEKIQSFARKDLGEVVNNEITKNEDIKEPTSHQDHHHQPPHHDHHHQPPHHDHHHPALPSDYQIADVNLEVHDLEKATTMDKEETHGSKENKEGDENAGEIVINDNKDDNDNMEGEVVAPPEEDEEAPCNLIKLSEDIDHFLLSISPLSSSKDQDKEAEDAPPAVDVPDCVAIYINKVEAKIVNYESGEGVAKWRCVEELDTPLLDDVNRMWKLTKCLSESKNNNPESLNHAGCVFEKAISFLEDEFRSLIEDFAVPESDPPAESPKEEPTPKKRSVDEEENKAESISNDDEATQFPGYSTDVVSTLNDIVKIMVAVGHETECFETYVLTRRQILGDCLHDKVGFEKRSMDEIHKMNWECLGKESSTWIKTFRQCTTVYFPGEKCLAQSMFPDADHNSASASTSVWEILFSNIVRGITIQLLNFAEAIAITKRSTEKLFKVLDMYETLRDTSAMFDSLFPELCVHELKAETNSARSRLGEAAVSIFCELENSIKSDTNKTPVPGGAVHPLTRYTINYLKYACEYKKTLEQVFKEHMKIERADSTSASDYQIPAQMDVEKAKESPFAVQLMRVMDLLDNYLDAKSKLYKDTALSHIFLMNNGQYVLQRIRAEINELMGDTWCRKRSSELRGYHKSYQRETWSKVLSCLSHEGLNVHGKVSKPALKERFKSFNGFFDEIHKTQSSWVVSDEQLQSELRVSISAVMIPAYRAFVGRFSQCFTPGRQTEKYVKYQPEDIETYIDELFDGNPQSSFMGMGMGKKR